MPWSVLYIAVATATIIARARPAEDTTVLGAAVTRAGGETIDRQHAEEILRYNCLLK